MNNQLIAMLKAQIAELETFIEFTGSDDTSALENFSAILTGTREKFEAVKVDQRVKCEECHDRIEDEDDSNDGFCVTCRRDNYSMLSTREAGYRAYINR